MDGLCGAAHCSCRLCDDLPCGLPGILRDLGGRETLPGESGQNLQAILRRERPHRQEPEQGSEIVGWAQPTTVATSPMTQFDQSGGKFVVGGCAKVYIRNGRVHEIDSEPMRDCQ